MSLREEYTRATTALTSPLTWQTKRWVAFVTLAISVVHFKDVLNAWPTSFSGWIFFCVYLLFSICVVSACIFLVEAAGRHVSRNGYWVRVFAALVIFLTFFGMFLFVFEIMAKRGLIWPGSGRDRDQVFQSSIAWLRNLIAFRRGAFPDRHAHQRRTHRRDPHGACLGRLERPTWEPVSRPIENHGNLRHILDCSTKTWPGL
jgi:hypothetical protein